MIKHNLIITINTSLDIIDQGWHVASICCRHNYITHSLFFISVFDIA